MYQRGKFTPGSLASAMAVALLLMLGIFSLVPLINQFKQITRSGARGLSPVATAPSARIESDQDSSSSIRTSRFELGARDSVPIGWTPMPKPVLDVPLELEMPELQNFEASDEARVQFVFNLEDLDFTPSPIYRKRPTYPVQLRREDFEGRVIAEFRVDRDGHTYDVRITESDHPDFSASVVEALLKWQFVPGLVDGEPVEFRMRIPMTFRIVASQQTDPDLYFASVD